MRFLVDAQLPVRLARVLRQAGHDVVHTIKLPDQNGTSDSEISRISVEQERVVITKDADFLESFLIEQVPYKLLLVTTGNIRNSELIELLEVSLERVVELFGQCSYIELSRDSVIVHQ